MSLKFGDIISFEFSDDSCWGPKGKYNGIVLYDYEQEKNLIHYLSLDLIKQREQNGCVSPANDILEDFINSTFATDIQVVINVARKNWDYEI